MTTANAAAPGTNPETHKIASYPAFDWLRFVLASVVVLSHGGFEFLPFLNGGLAVSVFFALSGWLIGGILLRTQRAELPRFFFNRATRIWIPYVVAIILLYGTAVVYEGVNVYWFKYLLFDGTFTHQLFTTFPPAQYEMPLGGSGNQFWSISVEEQFYLFAPIIMLFLPAGKTLRIWLVIAVLALLTHVHAASVALGVCAAILDRDYQITQRRFVRLGAAVVAIFCAVLMNQMSEVAVYPAAPFFAVAVVLALSASGRRSKVAQFFGGVSYPLYLNHWIAAFVVHAFEKLILRSQLPFAGYVISDYLVAVAGTTVLYVLIDREIQRRRNDWFTPQRGRRLGITGYCLLAIGLVAGSAVYQYGPHAQAPVKTAQGGHVS